MQRLFYGLVNGSFGDPGLYLELGGAATLIDCGDLRPLPAARIHRIAELAITHAHVDHFFGFDWLLRASLGEDRSLRIFGPEGIADRVGAKLEGYTWNIPLDFTFEAEVRELFPAARRALVSRFRLRSGLERRLRVEELSLPPDGTFAEGRTHRLRAVEVDHGTPCLAYAYEQKRGVRVRDADLDRLGLRRGEWIRDLKALVLSGAPGDTPFEADGRRFALGALAADLAEVVPGGKVAYVSDTTLTPEVRARVTDLARGASVLVCEAKYIERDRPKAQATRHLTAADAGALARDAGARELLLFHPSSRYEQNYDEVLAEARGAFDAARWQAEPAAELGGL